MDTSTITAIPAIAIICYLAAEATKAIWNPPEERKNIISVICGALGGILGGVSFFIPICEIHADYLLTAIAYGIVSGLAATGLHEAAGDYIDSVGCKLKNIFGGN